MRGLYRLGLSVVLGLVLSTQAFAQGKQIKGPGFVIQEPRDLGRAIEQGRPYTYRYVIRNTGDRPLIISDIQSSCGCMVPVFNRAPIFPSKQAEFEVRFDAAKPGPFNRMLVLRSSSGPGFNLRVHGTVKPKR